MAMRIFCIVTFVLVILRSVLPQEAPRREHFPDGFFFGTSSSSYQYEGSILEDGKGLSNWDVFTRVNGRVLDGTTGDIADDHYHRYMEDIELMHSLGVNAYRFSISWARILPRGRFGDVNPSGIKFYNKIIDELLARGIKPFVTIHHVDFPQELEKRYGSWLDSQMQDDFLHLADICFRSFGDRVKHWITVNEPNLVSLLEYFYGIFPPGRCSAPFGNCSSGDSEREPFIAAHNMILAHARAVHRYRNRYQLEQGGRIGIAVYAQMLWPLREMEEDRQAADRALAFKIAWILDPLIFGYYPHEMIEVIPNQLPRFSSNQVRMLKNSLDFIGVNHYTTSYVLNCLNSSCESGGYLVEGFTYSTGYRDGEPIGKPTAMQGNYVVPQGMEDMINYLQKRYNNLPMYVTENGYAEFNWPGKTMSQYLNDVERVCFHTSYLRSLHNALRNGASVRGYFAWSLLDNFEWTSGYTIKFGLYHVDYSTLRRSPKLSAEWYKEFLTGKSDNSSSMLRSPFTSKETTMNIQKKLSTPPVPFFNM